jgi:hypothetical protein
MCEPSDDAREDSNLTLLFFHLKMLMIDDIVGAKDGVAVGGKDWYLGSWGAGGRVRDSSAFVLRVRGAVVCRSWVRCGWFRGKFGVVADRRWAVDGGGQCREALREQGPSAGGGSKPFDRPRVALAGLDGVRT